MQEELNNVRNPIKNLRLYVEEICRIYPPFKEMVNWKRFEEFEKKQEEEELIAKKKFEDREYPLLGS